MQADISRLSLLALPFADRWPCFGCQATTGLGAVPTRETCPAVGHAGSGTVFTTRLARPDLGDSPLVKLCSWTCWRLFAMSIAGTKIGYGHQNHGHHGEARRDPKAVFKLVTPPGYPAQAT